MSDSVFIIAEAGVNHDGDLSKAHQLIDEAYNAGADAVKFQTFTADTLLASDAPKAKYQVETTGGEESQYQMLKRLELSASDHVELKRHCSEVGIRFLSTPFDIDSVDFLVNEIGVDIVKIPSGEITNGPLLWHIGRTHLPIILSTGMSTMEEVERAIAVLVAGYRGISVPETVLPVLSDNDLSTFRNRITLLHCTTEYPAPFEDVNLLAMESLASRFGLPVGYSDHTKGIVVSIAAVARGARVIEKHFTLDKTAPGPDHAASLEPGELVQMVDQIRLIETALGNRSKTAAHSEQVNIPAIRKSLYAKCAIPAGSKFSPDNIDVRRPGVGISPMQYWSLIDRTASRDYSPGDLLLEAELVEKKV